MYVTLLLPFLCVVRVGVSTDACIVCVLLQCFLAPLWFTRCCYISISRAPTEPLNGRCNYVQRAVHQGRVCVDVGCSDVLSVAFGMCVFVHVVPSGYICVHACMWYMCEGEYMCMSVCVRESICACLCV